MKKEVYEISSKTKISNELARHEIPLIELSDLQKDMFMYLCIKAVENVEKKERKFNAPIELSMRDFFKYSIRSNFSQMNEDMKNECSEELLRLFKKTFYISTDKSCEYYHYVDYIYIDKETFTISAALSPMIEDLAYKTVKGYTQIEFGNYAALKRKYSKDLYKYLKSYALHKHHSVSIDKIYEVLNIEADSPYRENMCDFKKRVLMPAIKEINEKTDIKVRGLYNVYQEAYEKLAENKGEENITDADKLRLNVNAMILRMDDRRTSSVKGLEFIIESKPIDERYSYIKNKVIRKQLIENAKKQVEYNKKRKYVESVMKKYVDNEEDMYQYSKAMTKLYDGMNKKY